MAKSDKIGDWFQAELWDRLQLLGKERRLYSHEFVDTRQAGRMVRSQPSDFMAITEGSETIFIEAKASEKHDSLRSCFAMVSDHQCSEARKLVKVGCRYMFWFYSEPRNMIEVWNGLPVAEARLAGTPLNKNDILFEIPWSNFKSTLEKAICK